MKFVHPKLATAKSRGEKGASVTFSLEVRLALTSCH
jgi:hypothetical protein